MMWTITHEDSNGERVKTFSYYPCEWRTQADAQAYLEALIQRGDLAARIYLDQPALMSSMRVDKVGTF